MDIKQFVFTHPRLIGTATKVYNTINVRNSKIHRGVRLQYNVARINGLKIRSKGHNNKIILGDYTTVINTTVFIHGDNNTIFIGEKSRINSAEFYLDGDLNIVSIGKQTHISGKTHLAAIDSTSITIGDQCLFSREIHFRTGDSHPIFNSNGQRINESKDIRIGNHCWIGYGVTCLKGVSLKDGTIVGATSTLTRSCDDENCIIVGVPGKQIAKDVYWDVI